MESADFHQGEGEARGMWDQAPVAYEGWLFSIQKLCDPVGKALVA